MSRLPIINARDFEKILLKLGFEIKRQKEVTFFIDIQMAAILHCLIIPEGTWHVRWSPQILREIRLTAEDFSKLIDRI